MAWEIFVENQFMDAPDDLSAQLTYNIDDIREFGFRNTNFSKTVVLPGTARNKKHFGHVFDAGSGNFVNAANPNIGYDFDASRAAACIIFMDNIQVFKGVIRIMKIVTINGEVEFETAVFGELGGLIAAIEGKKLEELDFSAYDHTLSVSNIKNTWDAAIGSGVYYPLIDYGYSTDKKRFPIENFRPALHVREYLEKIFTDAGYTFSSSFFDTDYFKKIVMPYNGNYLKREVTSVFEHSRPGSWSLFGHPTAFTTMELFIVGTSLLQYSTASWTLTWPRREGFRAKFTFTTDWTKTNPATKYYSVGLKRQDGTIEYFFSGEVTGASGTVTGEFVADIAPGEVFSFASNYNAGSSETMSFTNTEITIEGQPNIEIPLALGETVEVNNAIPKNIFQIDFVKWLIKMFNLYITEDKERANHLNISPFIYYYDTDNKDNWEGKIDRTKPTEYQPMGELNSRSYEFKYKDDSDFYNAMYKNAHNETYGSIVHDTGFEFSKEKTTVEVGFSPTPLVQFENSDRVISAIYKREGDHVKNYVYSRIAHNPRILFRSEEPVACQPWYIGYGITADLIIEGYPYCGHLDDIDAPANDLNFGSPREFYFAIVTGSLSANLFNVFWSLYISEISDKDSKLLTAFFKLNPADIYALDFSRTKYIDGQLWRLNKVIDYSTDNNGASTKCELLKVIDLI
jgi:hypothetical protein